MAELLLLVHAVCSLAWWLNHSSQLMLTAHGMTGAPVPHGLLDNIALLGPAASSKLRIIKSPAVVTLRSALPQKWVRPAGQQGRQTSDRQLLPEHDVWYPGAAGASPDAERAGLLATGEAHRRVLRRADTGIPH